MGSFWTHVASRSHFLPLERTLGVLVESKWVPNDDCRCSNWVNMGLLALCRFYWALHGVKSEFWRLEGSRTCGNTIVLTDESSDGFEKRGLCGVRVGFWDTR